MRKAGLQITESMLLVFGSSFQVICCRKVGDMIDNRSFSVARFRSYVAEKLGNKIQMGQFNWNAWVPRKVVFFMWKFNLGTATECTFIKAIWWHISNWTKLHGIFFLSDINGMLDGIFNFNGSKTWKRGVEALGSVLCGILESVEGEKREDF
ncbi:hypothetical protein HanRHA438_Chr04g0195651 [Helianthus annuus]|nr:hypothetical protein HanRHA438_Chr04g0195651 [Helianthus annuus]